MRRSLRHRCSSWPVPLSERSLRCGFTLIEFVLAVAIASVLLFFVIGFYQQAARVRSELQHELDGVGATRLLLEHVSEELQTALYSESEGKGLRGGPHYIEFLATSLPSENAWNRDDSRSSGAGGEIGFRWISYRFRGVESEGFDDPPGVKTESVVRVEEIEFVGGEEEEDEILATDGGVPGSDEEADLPTIERLEKRWLGRTAKPEKITMPLSNHSDELRFRYYDGSEWLDSWGAAGLPRGVELSIGEVPSVDALPVDDLEAGASQRSDRLFRRVIYVATSTPLVPTVPRSDEEIDVEDSDQ